MKTYRELIKGRPLPVTIRHQDGTNITIHELNGASGASFSMDAILDSVAYGYSVVEPPKPPRLHAFRSIKNSRLYLFPDTKLNEVPAGLMRVPHLDQPEVKR